MLIDMYAAARSRWAGLGDGIEQQVREERHGRRADLVVPPVLRVLRPPIRGIPSVQRVATAQGCAELEQRAADASENLGPKLWFDGGVVLEP